MPTILRIDGHRFLFFSNEGDEPPHVHVETAEKAAKFWLRPVVLAYSRGYSSPDQSLLRGLVVEHCELFEGRWHEYFDGK
jgi:hypothetical protein